MARYRELLKNRNFVLYNAGQMISQFANTLLHIALIGIVYKIAPGSSIQLAKVLFFTVLPSFLISPIAGVYVDRLNKKNVLITSNIICSFIIITMPLLFLRFSSLVPIYCSVFIIFASTCFFLPARLSIIPDLVDKEHILIANSLTMTSWTVAGILGFTTGALIIEFLGIRYGLYLDASFYLASAVTLTCISRPKKIIKYKLSLPRSIPNAPGLQPGDEGKVREAERKAPAFRPGLKRGLQEMEKYLEMAIRRSFLYDLKEGLAYLVSHKNTRLLVGLFFVFMSVAGSLYVVTVVFIQRVTRSMTASLGIFGLFLFIGFLIGSYIYGKTGHRFSRNIAIFASFILSGFFIAAFAIALKISGSIISSVFLLLLLGISLSPVATSASTIIHETIDEGVRGRIFSLIGMIMNGGFIIFMFLSSFLAEYMERMWIIITCGFILSTVGIIGYILNKRKGFIVLS